MNTYVLSELETDPDHRTDAVAVGNYDVAAKRIQAAGAITNLGSGVSLAVLWEKIGATINPINLETVQNSFALALNDVYPSQVVGWVESGGRRLGVMWEKTGTTILPSLGGDTEAHGVNNSGAVAGWSKNGGGSKTAFLWQLTGPAQLIALGGLGGSESEALDINDSGVIAGRAQTAAGHWHACVWIPTPGGPPQIQDVHPAGYLTSSANAVNVHGNVAGEATTSAGQQPFFLPAGGAHQWIGTLGGDPNSARALNDNDEVVGYSYLSPGGISHGFCWKPGTATGDLAGALLPGTIWLFNRADGINADGDIVGTGRNTGDRIRGALLRPLGPDPLGLTDFVSSVNPKQLDRMHWALVFIHIITGGVAGSPGWGILPGVGIVPIPPRPVDRMVAGTFASQDSMMLLLLSEVAQAIQDDRTRNTVQRQFLESAAASIHQQIGNLRGT